jgi:hypothetical protein
VSPMRRLPVLALALSLPAWPGLGDSSLPAEKKIDFQAPLATEVRDIPYPPNSIAIGTVVLRVEVSVVGEVTSVQPVREIVSLTEPATTAVESWKFAPAKLDGKPIASETTVAVTFNPAVNKPTDVPLPPAKNEESAKEPRYVPPDVDSASFSEFPLGGIVFGTVGFDLAIGPNGALTKMKVVRDIVSLTGPGQNALKKWKFAPARFDGRPVQGHVVVAFVSRLPAY